jgi:hypothetical protein
MWKPRRLTTPWASTACYRDSFKFLCTSWPSRSTDVTSETFHYTDSKIIFTLSGHSCIQRRLRFFIRPYFQIPLQYSNLNPKKCAALVNGPLRLPGFEPRSHNLAFVMDKMAQEQVLSEYLRFPYQSAFPKLLHTHPLTDATQSQNWHYH